MQKLDTGRLARSSLRKRTGLSRDELGIVNDAIELSYQHPRLSPGELIRLAYWGVSGTPDPEWQKFLTDQEGAWKLERGMTQKQRRLVYEAIAIGAAGLLMAFVVPTLVSERNSIAAVCGGLLVILLVGWVAWFFYRARNL